MGWAIGNDGGRDIGYGVPATCDQTTCKESIDRGLGYVCGAEPYGGEYGCGLFFCYEHLTYGEQDNEYGDCSPQLCEICAYNWDLGDERWKEYKKQFTPSSDTDEWIWWKLIHSSWEKWRKENKDEVLEMRARFNA